MPDTGYGDYGDSMDECKRSVPDGVDDPAAYCAQVYYEVNGHYPYQKSAPEVFDTAETYIESALEAKRRTGADPAEVSRLADRAEWVGDLG
mgnify:CR=1 FL=1